MRDQRLGLGPQGLGFAAGLLPPCRRLGFPDPDGTVAGAGRQARAIGTESQGEDIVRCPSSRATSWPVARSQSQTARSRPPEASRVPSG